MKYLKLVQKGYESYSGPIGAYEFVDGVSTTPIHRHDRDRLATAFQFVEIDEKGEEQEAGIAARLVRDAQRPADVEAALQRQTATEKLAELDAARQASKVEMKILTVHDLEKIVDSGGIKALRQVGDSWKVKHRSIPVLIQLILDAQEKYLALQKIRGELEEAVKEQTQVDLEREALLEQIESDNDQIASSSEPEKNVEHDDLLKAAASGDMAAAVSQE